ncbi:hypothetical protein [uncultured Microbacterium sp.]|uniref:hypothetical protein n=1 Tax=uncultured Microbacterium sp. TaxID=191216 RepID=UPI0025DCA9C0|nr:hypothetical protein [uncultured Microbacterium sp.]
MSAAEPWFVCSSTATPTPLPAGAPLPAQYLNGALANLAPVIFEDVAAGRENSRRVRTALAQLASVERIPLLPSRAAIGDAARYLRAVGVLPPRRAGAAS